MNFIHLILRLQCCWTCSKLAKSLHLHCWPKWPKSFLLICDSDLSIPATVKSPNHMEIWSFQFWILKCSPKSDTVLIFCSAISVWTIQFNKILCQFDMTILTISHLGRWTWTVMEDHSGGKVRYECSVASAHRNTTLPLYFPPNKWK